MRGWVVMVARHGSEGEGWSQGCRTEARKVLRHEEAADPAIVRASLHTLLDVALDELAVLTEPVEITLPEEVQS